MALALLAVIDAVPPAVVEVTFTGEGGKPVSAEPRSLSDVARERKEGRKAVGGFSAVETTVPRSSSRYVPPVERETEESEAEPEIEPEAVEEPPSFYEPMYAPTWYGGYPGRIGHRHRFASHPIVKGPAPRHVHRPSPQPFHQMQIRTEGRSWRPFELGGSLQRVR